MNYFEYKKALFLLKHIQGRVRHRMHELNDPYDGKDVDIWTFDDENGSIIEEHVKGCDNLPLIAVYWPHAGGSKCLTLIVREHSCEFNPSDDRGSETRLDGNAWRQAIQMVVDHLEKVYPKELKPLLFTP